jgi:hypothetical protein
MSPDLYVHLTLLAWALFLSLSVSYGPTVVELAWGSSMGNIARPMSIPSWNFYAFLSSRPPIDMSLISTPAVTPRYRFICSGAFLHVLVCLDRGVRFCCLCLALTPLVVLSCTFWSA